MTIKAARIIAGYTQVEMAEMLGISRDTYMKYEKNPDAMPVAYAKQIAKITNQSIDTLIF